MDVDDILGRAPLEVHEHVARALAYPLAVLPSIEFNNEAVKVAVLLAVSSLPIQSQISNY